MKLIILDRDGVINEDSDDFIKSPEEWHAIPDSLNAIAALNKAGFTVIVASNQSGIGRGYFSTDALNKINQKMINELAKKNGTIKKIYFCPHKPEDHCDCRKPKIKMFKNIENDFQIDLKETISIGDSYRDYEAAKEIGSRFILVLTGKGIQTLDEHPELKYEITICKDLSDAVNYILGFKCQGQ